MWYGPRYVPADKETAGESESEEEFQERRPVVLFALVYNRVAAGLVLSLC
jgi:hypothetical protein